LAPRFFLTACIAGFFLPITTWAYTTSQIEIHYAPHENSSNFSRSGLASQDNDLIFINDQAVVDMFEANFDRIWARARNVAVFDPPTTGDGR
jgi:hypothetical protein